MYLGYSCQDILEHITNAIPIGGIDEIVYVEYFSSDNSVTVARALNINHVILHDHNIGYRGYQILKSTECGTEILSY